MSRGGDTIKESRHRRHRCLDTASSCIISVAGTSSIDTRQYTVLDVNYDDIADSYDDHRRAGGPYIPPLAALARAANARRVLELGSGTGNGTSAFLNAYPCALTGLELSAGMLDKARKKPIPARWVRGSGTHIPLADAGVDFVFGCYVLHHVPDLEVLLRECARVIGKGRAAFVTASHEFIENYPIRRYFPSFVAIDKARFPTVERIQEALAASGFEAVDVETIIAPRGPIDHAYAEKIASKFVSTYRLLPEAEFEEGLRRLRADLEPTGRLDLEFTYEATIVWGAK